jgi:hypothetical protein
MLAIRCMMEAVAASIASVRISAVPENTADDATCIEVTGSHVGMIFNRRVYRAIANSLAKPELSVTD